MERSVEIIAIASGKGGTGKTIVAVSLGYALTRVGHRVLMIDADTGTDGLSLFLLGPNGQLHQEKISAQNTLAGYLTAHSRGELLEVDPFPINRTGTDDHGVEYLSLISGSGLYGDIDSNEEQGVLPRFTKQQFRGGIRELLNGIRERGEFDYVLVDTRGGFAFETTDLCALVDSFIVVTEPDFTSFYQDRNLIQHISLAADELDTKPLLRSIIVNKATETESSGKELDVDKLETSFRLELTKEFPINLQSTHAVPLDIEAIKSYKEHKVPFRDAPASRFSYALMKAFSEIMRVVTSRWERPKVDAWNVLTDEITDAIRSRNRAVQEEENRRTARAKELSDLRAQADEQNKEIEILQARVQDSERVREEISERYEREIRRADQLFQSDRSPSRTSSWYSQFQIRIWNVLIPGWLTLVAVIATVLYGAFAILLAVGVIGGDSDGTFLSPVVPTATVVTPTDVPPTAVPPTAVQPTAVPPTAVPPTAVPPTAVPPTAFPPTSTAVSPSTTPTPLPTGIPTPKITLAGISGGGQHTCGLTAFGGVKCWGGNSFGQLGDGTTTHSSAPVDVSGLTSGVAAVVVGGEHTCALTTGGAVKCWGRNRFGQTGDGTTTLHTAPVNVNGLTSGVRALGAGFDHTCAVTSSGGLKCWGFNGAGQLGDGTTTDRTTPIDVTGLTSAVAVTGGVGHTCTLTTTGGLKCWGQNFLGHLGDGTFTDRTTPVDVSGLTSGVAAVTAGSDHTCAVTTTGGLKCWGSNNVGQIGDGTTIIRNIPVNVINLTSGVAEVTVGGSHTCALTTGNGVQCWGWNQFGQIGDGTNNQSSTPINVNGLATGATAVTAGSTHSCAIITAVGAKCWGWNSGGQLGDGTTTDSNLPVPVSGF